MRVVISPIILVNLKEFELVVESQGLEHDGDVIVKELLYLSLNIIFSNFVLKSNIYSQ